MEDTKAMLDIAVNEGIKVIAATHHFMDEKTSIEEYETLWNDRYQKVMAALDEQQSKVKIVKGAEVAISPFLIGMEGIDRLCINGSRYLLIELPMIDIPLYIEDVIYGLRIKGFVPIIAHPERNRRIMENPNLLLPYIDMGALGQVNTGSITGMFGKEMRWCARVLLDHNMAHLISTDAHSPVKRAPVIKRSVEILQKWAGRELADDIINERPRAILDNVMLQMDDPKPYKRRIISFP